MLIKVEVIEEENNEVEEAGCSCDVCGRSFTSRKKLERHVIPCTAKSTPGSHPCTKCDLVFVSAQKLKNHQSVHSTRSFICDICGNGFRRQPALRRHMLTHSNQRDFKCKECNATYKCKGNLRTHEMRHRAKPPVGSRKYVCPICKTPFKCRLSLDKHFATHDNARTFPCLYCDKIFYSAGGLRVHDSICHQSINRSCAECKKDFKVDEPFCSHLRQQNVGHVKRNKAVPQRHGKGSKAEYADFMASNDKCGGCARNFITAEKLQEHLLVPDTTSYKCPTCGIEENNHCAMLHHVRRTHLQDHSFMCNICGVTYRSVSGVTFHKMRTHGSKNNFACSFCNKLFLTKYNRDEHERIHTNERPFACEICGARFKWKQKMKVHMTTHTDERPYQCTVCGKRMRLPYNLRVHMRTHTGEKPYACRICGRAFAQNGDCRKHEKTHKAVDAPVKTDRPPQAPSERVRVTKNDTIINEIVVYTSS